MLWGYDWILEEVETPGTQDQSQPNYAFYSAPENELIGTISGGQQDGERMLTMTFLKDNVPLEAADDILSLASQLYGGLSSEHSLTNYFSKEFGLGENTARWEIYRENLVPGSKARWSRYIDKVACQVLVEQPVVDEPQQYIVGITIASDWDTFFLLSRFSEIPDYPLSRSSEISDYPLTLDVVEQALLAWRQDISIQTDPITNRNGVVQSMYRVFSTENEAHICTITSGQRNGERVLVVSFPASYAINALPVEESSVAVTFAAKLFGGFHGADQLKETFLKEYDQSNTGRVKTNVYSIDHSYTLGSKARWGRLIDGIACQIILVQPSLEKPQELISEIIIATNWDEFYPERTLFERQLQIVNL